MAISFADLRFHTTFKKQIIYVWKAETDIRPWQESARLNSHWFKLTGEPEANINPEGTGENNEFWKHESDQYLHH